MFPKWLCVLIICLCFSTSTVSASPMDVANNKHIENNTDIIKLNEKLDQLYAKREALSEAYFEIDQKIFELQKEILEVLKK
ncbi:MAG: hypothetical protein ACQEWV_32615 [Bacillota bacterium]